MFKTVFVKVRGRVIPIRKSLKGAPDEMQKIVHKQKAMAALKKPTSTDSFDRRFEGAFFKSSKKLSKISGEKIARRIARLKKHG